MEGAPKYWENPEIISDMYVSKSGGAQGTNAIAGPAADRPCRPRHRRRSHRGGFGSQARAQINRQHGECCFDRLGRQHLCLMVALGAARPQRDKSPRPVR
jgi:hypothetical protein